MKTFQEQILLCQVRADWLLVAYDCLGLTLCMSSPEAMRSLCCWC